MCVVYVADGWVLYSGSNSTSNDDAQVKELVGRGGCVMETRDRGGRCGMHLSAGRGRLEVVEYLWSKGLDVDVEDKGELVS